MHSSRKPLDFNLYEQYEISQSYKAYIVEYLNIDENEVEKVEYDLIQEGNKIFHSNLTRVQGNLFNLEVIIGSVSFTF